MKITLSVIAADLGSIGAHNGPSRRPYATVSLHAGEEERGG